MPAAILTAPIAPLATGDAVEAADLLDDAREWPAFGHPVGGTPDLWESHLVIEGMHCAACALSVEEILRGVPGVIDATVSAASQRARLRWSTARTRPSHWARALARAGYRLLPAHDAQARQQRRVQARRMLWRWLVAGLCMMQVMMYAWPAYVAEPGDLTAEMAQLLRWASWVLTLPVIFFSCGPFFANAWRDVLQRRVSMDLPVALGIAITFAVSSAGTFAPQGLFGQEVYFDSLTMFVFFLLTGRWLELRLHERTAGALDALMNRLPDSVLRQRADGAFERVTARRLLPGDVVRVLPGEVFPADGVLLEGRTQVDEALLTGESRPLARGAGDGVLAGSHNLAAAVLARIERIGPHTRFARIVALMESAATSKPQLAQLADRVAKPFLLAVLAAAAAAAVLGWARDPAQALMAAVAVLVVTCPCALSLATPTAMLAAAGALARGGVLVRRLQGLEALAGIDTLVFDKTGTLTRDALALDVVRTRAGVSREQALGLAAALARHSLHPVSRALVAAARARGGLEDWQAEAVHETAGQGLAGRAGPGDGGARESLRLGAAGFCGVELPPAAGVRACLSDARGWLATFEFSEGVREDAQAAISALRAQGVEVRLWSGDSAAAVQRVARAVGIDHAVGACSPQDKLDLLRQARAAGRKVAMVGDGLNDGPVLAGADVSFAVGRAVPLARAQADFVLLGERLVPVAQTLALARRTLRVVRQNLGWAALYNALCVPLALMGWLPAWLAGLGMAASSLLVVLNALRLSRAPGAREPA